MAVDRRPRDPAALGRRKADLLLASALAREQAGLALDEVDAGVGRVEAGFDRLKQRAAAIVGDGPSGLVRVFALPLVAGLLAARLLRRRRRPAPASPSPARGRGLATAGLLLAVVPRLLSLWRWHGHGRRAWRAWRWWKSRQRARAPGGVRR